MGFSIFDISTPATPILEGTITGRGSPNFMHTLLGGQVSGNYAYLASFVDDCLTVVDTSNKSNPTFETRQTDTLLDGAVRVRVVGNYAYIISGSSLFSIPYALVIIDITDPTNPSVVGTLEHQNINGLTCLHVVGDYAYIGVSSGGNEGRVVVIDISTPASPQYKGTYSDNYLKYIKNIYKVGNYCYCVSSNLDSFIVVDVTDPENPSLHKRITGSGAPYYLDDPYGIMVVSNYAYIACDGGNQLLILDILDPENPAFEGRLQDSANELVGAGSVFVTGGYAYVVASGYDYLTIIDISTPSSPSLVGSINGVVNGILSPNEIDVSGDYAYVTSVSELNNWPSITTQAMSSIKGTTATGHGTIVDIGSSAVTQHGHCWATTVDPTTSNSKTTNGATTAGAFTSSLDDLIIGRKYYARAYATNTEETVYGANVKFIAGGPGTQLWGGNLGVKGTRLQYVDNDGKERYIEGTLI